MKCVSLIYNPKSGDKSFPGHLDSFITKFQRKGYIVDIYRSMEAGDLGKNLRDLNQEKYKMIIVAGGDGSVNELVNVMINNDINKPLGIIPAGTANDFASQLKMPANIEQAIDKILLNNKKKIDIGRVNQKYFVNVCVGGALANISYTTDNDIKNMIGKLAYYLKGIKEIPKFKPMHLQITTSKQTIDDNFLMFIILNSKGAGGFKNIARNAVVNDELFDFIGIKSNSILKFPATLARFFQGEQSNDENITYFQDNYFLIEHLDQQEQQLFCDIDGEKGPSFPLEISLLPQALTVFTNQF